jgi:phosphatidylglycerol:prolipoprotein diacylglycerol transferase
MRPILFELFGIPVYAYGATLAVAFIVGAKIGAWRARKAGVDDEHVYGVALWCFFAALIGARLLFVVIEDRTLLPKPLEWLRFWDGGLVFYGGFFGAVAASLVYTRRKKVPFRVLADLVAPVIALGHGFVRVGCFLNGCCHGKPVSWGIVIPTVDKLPRHPTQLYEAAAGVLLFFVLLLYEKKVQKAKGELILLYIALYGITRFLIELIRDDFRGGFFLHLAISQWIGIAALVAGLIGVILLRRHETAPPAQA